MKVKSGARSVREGAAASKGRLCMYGDRCSRGVSGVGEKEEVRGCEDCEKGQEAGAPASVVLRRTRRGDGREREFVVHGDGTRRMRVSRSTRCRRTLQ